VLQGPCWVVVGVVVDSSVVDVAILAVSPLRKSRIGRHAFEKQTHIVSVLFLSWRSLTLVFEMKFMKEFLRYGFCEGMFGRIFCDGGFSFVRWFV